MADNPYKIPNLNELKKSAADWKRLTDVYPILWNFPTFDAYYSYKTQNPNAPLPDVDPGEWKKFEAYQQYYGMFPEGHKDEADAQRKAQEFEKHKTQQEEQKRKYAQQKLQYDAGGGAGIALAPIALIAKPFSLAESMQEDKRYKKILEQIHKEWQRNNPGKSITGKTFLKDEHGKSYLNPELVKAIPNIHQLAEASFRGQYTRRADRYDRKKEKQAKNLLPKQGLFSLANKLQEDKDYIKTLEQIREEWNRANPNKLIKGDTFLVSKNGIRHLNPELFAAIPNIQEVAEAKFRDQHKIKSWRYDHKKDDSPLQKAYDSVDKRAQEAYLVWNQKSLTEKGVGQIGFDEFYQKAKEDAIYDLVKKDPKEAEKLAKKDAFVKAMLDRYKADQAGILINQRLTEAGITTPELTLEEKELKRFNQELTYAVRQEYYQRLAASQQNPHLPPPNWEEIYQKTKASKARALILDNPELAKKLGRLDRSILQVGIVKQNTTGPQQGRMAAAHKAATAMQRELDIEPPQPAPQARPMYRPPSQPPQRRRLPSFRKPPTPPMARPGLSPQQLALQQLKKRLIFLPQFWVVVGIIAVILLLIILLLLILGGDDDASEVPVIVDKSGPVEVPNPTSEDDSAADLEYTINVSYAGKADAIEVIDKIPDNATFVRAEGPGNPTFDGNNTVTWRITPTNLESTSATTRNSTLARNVMPIQNVLGIKKDVLQAATCNVTPLDFSSLGVEKRLLSITATGRTGECVPNPINIVMHTTAGATTAEDTYDWFENKGGKGLGSHFTIGQDGKIIQMVEMYEGAVEFVQTVGSFKSHISIEMGSSGSKPVYESIAEMTPEQYASAKKLVKALATTYNIPIGSLEYNCAYPSGLKLYADLDNCDGFYQEKGIYGHYQLSPSIRTDPGRGWMREFREELKNEGLTGDSIGPGTGGSGSFGTIAPLKIVLRPKFNATDSENSGVDTYITNVASARAINPQNNSSSPGSVDTSAPNQEPNAENCGGNYDLSNPINKNFGDPACDFNKDDLLALLRQVDPANADAWFYTVIPCESAYNPNTWFLCPAGVTWSPNSDVCTPDPAGAWGLYQTGSSSNGPGTPGNGRNGPSDRGDVPWRQQTSNAANLLKSNGWGYWACRP
jgi:hypothetical protein